MLLCTCKKVYTESVDVMGKAKNFAQEMEVSVGTKKRDVPCFLTVLSLEGHQLFGTCFWSAFFPFSLAER